MASDGRQAALIRASHYIALGYRGEVDKEEAFLTLECDTGSTRRTLRVACDRYRASNGITPWRWYIRDIEPEQGIGPAKREILRLGITALVDGWLAGIVGTADDGAAGMYGKSRERALALAVAREIRDMRTTADYRAKAALDAQADEMNDDDADRLNAAYQSMLRALTLTEG